MSCKIIFLFVLVAAGVAAARWQLEREEPARADDVIDERGEHEIAGAGE